MSEPMTAATNFLSSMAASKPALAAVEPPVAAASPAAATPGGTVLPPTQPIADDFGLL